MHFCFQNQVTPPATDTAELLVVERAPPTPEELSGAAATVVELDVAAEPPGPVLAVITDVENHSCKLWQP